MAPMKATEASDVVTVTMQRAQALVLEDFLMRYETRWNRVVDHPAEQMVLWFLQAALEPVLEDELRDPQYDQQIQRARTLVHPGD